MLLISVTILTGCITVLPDQSGQPGSTPVYLPVGTRAPTRTPRPTPSQAWLDWSRRWLTPTPCQAPCWENITPNRTTVKEAFQVLQSSPIIATDTVHILRDLCGGSGSPEIANSRRIVWQWTSAGYGEGGTINYVQQPPVDAVSKCGVDFFVMEIITPDETTLNSPITKIELESLSAVPRAYQPTLGDVIKAYGEPTYIVAVESPEFSWYYVNIIYESQGLVLKRVSRSMLDLDQDLDFENVIFTDDPVREGIDYFDEDVLIVWQGIHDFAFYCRYENGAHCP